MRSAQDLHLIRAATLRRNLALCRDFAILCVGRDSEATSEEATRAIAAFNLLAAAARDGNLSALEAYKFDWWVKNVLQTLAATELNPSAGGGDFLRLAAGLDQFLPSQASSAKEKDSCSGSLAERMALHLFSALRRRPPLEPDAAVVELDMEWAESLGAWKTNLREASRLIACSAVGSALVFRFIGALVPIHNRSGFAHKSTSMAAVPGAVFLSASDSSQMLAEAIVHEADHQYLYQLTAVEPLLASTAENKAEIYRSPWRLDPRPAHGLLFGASAFSRVAACFVDALPEVDADLQRALGRRATLATCQALDATQTLRKQCSFEAQGEAFLSELQEELVRTKSWLMTCSEWSRWEGEACSTMSAAEASWRSANSALLG